ncbi:diacetyl reductase [(S)-acetoin forming]-like [Liolophura sinensis]|uniref:diacetyl reductase [(S)-acetoin forming]-like n=1 Tax=Liolophura sinensis TaxID=3198878 RepID=UPI0031586ED6
MDGQHEPSDPPTNGLTDHGAILLTGGTTGIGLGTAQELVLLGFRKFILGYATHDEHANVAKSNLEQNKGVKVVLVKGDVSEKRTVEEIFKVVDEDFGGSLYAILHTAGVMPPINDEEPEKTFDAFTELYPKAFWRLVERGVPYMEKSPHGGRIVVLSNPGVNLMSSPRPFYLMAGCGKAALEYLTRHYALVLAPKRITCNVVIPGITKTKGWKEIDPTELAERRCPMKEVIQPEDVGAALAFLVSPKARFITGAFLPVDGGLMFV